MPVVSVCVGCAYEEACGHADVRTCTKRKPAKWCSCDPLRKAEAERDEWKRVAHVKQEIIAEAHATCVHAQAERDRYRAMVLSLVCQASQDADFCEGSECERPDGSYCDTVIEEVDGNGR